MVDELSEHAARVTTAMSRWLGSTVDASWGEGTKYGAAERLGPMHTPPASSSAVGPAEGIQGTGYRLQAVGPRDGAGGGADESSAVRWLLLARYVERMARQVVGGGGQQLCFFLRCLAEEDTF